MKKLTLSVLCIAANLAMIASASAAVAEPEPPAPPPAACDITFATGPTGKGYSKMYANLKAMCPQIPMCEKPTEGALDNFGQLNSKEADIALGDVFTLQSLIQGGGEQYKSLQVVASLHSNMLHAVTLSGGITIPGPMVAGEKVKNPKYSKYNPLNKEPELIDGPQVPGPAITIEINKFSDLKGKPVGVVGSAQLIGRKLDKIAGHGMQFIDYDKDSDAFTALKAGKVYGVLTVAAWPHGSLKDLKQSSGLRLVSYDLAPTPPMFVTKRDYKGLGQYNIDLLAVPNALFTRPFTVGGENAKLIAAVKSCITTNLGKFKDGKYEPAWNEVSDLSQTYSLPAFVGTGGASAKPVKK